jgi:signal transduction histidine kinase
MMRRLYLQIYLAFVGILLLFGILASIAWYVMAPNLQDRQALDGLGAVMGDVLPGPQQPQSVLQAALQRLASQLPNHRFTVRSADGTLLGSVGEPLAAPPADSRRSRWTGFGPTLALRLPDTRWLIVRRLHPQQHFGWLLTLALLATAIAIGSYPIVRRITGRLERLQGRVDALGAGTLTTRVEVEGNDEVANLARSFNHAADRIERLVNAQRTALASVSHELRSPLARIRMAVELLQDGERPELRARLTQDIAELDDLIGELLLASRLDTFDRPERSEEVDLLALLAEEAARSNASVRGKPVSIQGDPRMLRRLLRNLLDNARRYADGSPIEATIGPLDHGGALLRIADQGPGVPVAERERIFEPFYRSASERSDRGVGLGLSLVRQIARHHAGEVYCLPREGGGTCFEVKLRGHSGPVAQP